MYCPNCGNKNSADQKFCRSCGLSLEKSAQSLAEQLPSPSIKSLQERKEKLERLGLASLSVFGLGVVGFILYGVFYEVMLRQGALIAVLAVLGAAIFIGSAITSVILFAKANELKEESAKPRIGSGTTRELPDGTTSKLPDSLDQPRLSVTERTTNLLNK
jgi:uncharacterized membrane protein YvbJ